MWLFFIFKRLSRPRQQIHCLFSIWWWFLLRLTNDHSPRQWTLLDHYCYLRLKAIQIVLTFIFCHKFSSFSIYFTILSKRKLSRTIQQFDKNDFTWFRHNLWYCCCANNILCGVERNASFTNDDWFHWNDCTTCYGFGKFSLRACHIRFFKRY